MLTEERYNIILELLREKRSVTVAEIKDRLGISESTIRRDLNALAQEGKLTKVFCLCKYESLSSFLIIILCGLFLKANYKLIVKRKLIFRTETPEILAAFSSNPI